MNEGIEEFHENMTRQGVEQDISIEEAMKRQEEKKGIPPGQIQNFSYAATMNKIKETKNNNEFAGKERERRNRKQLVDQRKIQERLDAAKYEENLIQRLLEKQTAEQKTAYTRLRQEQCRRVVFENRRAQAEETDRVKQERNNELEQEMKKAAEENEPKRQAAHQAKKDELAVRRREEKRKKRQVNIEIASELIDVILDVADVAYNSLIDAPAEQQPADHDQLTTHVFGEDQLIKKAQWRHWMGIIASGKKVSEENLVISTDDTTGQKHADSMPQIGLSAAQGPYKLMSEMKSEPIFDELLQYVCMCGPLNLRLVAAEKWHQFRETIENDKSLAGHNMNLNFLNDVYVPRNKELGAFLERLYTAPKDEAASQQASRTRQADASGSRLEAEKPAKEAPADEGSAQGAQTKAPQQPAHVTDFPSYHPLKLCVIGRAYSGKSTQASVMLKALGDKVTLFDMG